MSDYLSLITDANGDSSYVHTTSEIFQHFYPQLIDLLPMNDVVYLSKFFSANLPEDHVQLESTHKQTHFQESVIKPSVTLTELYQLFIVTTIQKQVKDDDKPTHLVDSEVEKILCEMLKGIPKQAVETVFCLSRLAYRGFFDWCTKKRGIMKATKRKVYVKTPKLIFTVEDLIECGLKVTNNLYDLLKVVNTDQLPTDSVTFSFAHFTIQTFMCALYLATLPHEEQEQLLNGNFCYYLNVVSVFWSGLVSSKAVKLIASWLLNESYSVTAVRCVYESHEANLVQPSMPFRLNFQCHILSPYDCLATSTVLSHLPVEELCMVASHIGDEGIRTLTTHLNNGHLKLFDLTDNSLTVIGTKLLANAMLISKFCCDVSV